MRLLVKVGIAAIIIFAGVSIVLDEHDTRSHNCKPTGVQRMVNTVDGLKVEDQLRCDGGRTKWSLQYN